MSGTLIKFIDASYEETLDVTFLPNEPHDISGLIIDPLFGTVHEQKPIRLPNGYTFEPSFDLYAPEISEVLTEMDAALEKMRPLRDEWFKLTDKLQKATDIAVGVRRRKNEELCSDLEKYRVLSQDPAFQGSEIQQKLVSSIITWNTTRKRSRREISKYCSDQEGGENKDEGDENEPVADDADKN